MAAHPQRVCWYVRKADNCVAEVVPQLVSQIGAERSVSTLHFTPVPISQTQTVAQFKCPTLAPVQKQIPRHELIFFGLVVSGE